MNRPSRTVALRHLGDCTVSLHHLDRVQVTTPWGEASLYAGSPRASRVRANDAYHLLGEADGWLSAYAERHLEIGDDARREAYYTAVNVRSGRCPDGCCGMGADCPPETEEQARRLADVAWAADLVARALGFVTEDVVAARDAATEAEARTRLVTA